MASQFVALSALRCALMLEHCEHADLPASLRREYPASRGALLGWMCDRKERAYQIGIPFPPESREKLRPLGPDAEAVEPESLLVGRALHIGRCSTPWWHYVAST